MRRTRMKKYHKNNQSFSIAPQLLVIWLVLYGGMQYFTSGTFATFTSSQKVAGNIELGSWWDKSELAFISNKTDQHESCEPVKIDFGIRNDGFTMAGTTKYEVYYSPDGNPKNDGKKIAEGDLPPIEAGKEAVLTYTADKEGSYIFKVYQRPGYEAEANREIWSGQITVKCSAVEKAPEKEAESAIPRDTENVEKNNNGEKNEAPLEKENAKDQTQDSEQPDQSGQTEGLNNAPEEKVEEPKEEEEPASEKQEDANGENIEQP